MNRFKIIIVNEHTGENRIFNPDEYALAITCENEMKSKIYSEIITIVPETECFGCIGKDEKPTSMCRKCLKTISK